METVLTTRYSDSRANALIGTALQGLERMCYSDTKLFCHRLNQTPFGLVKEGTSHRYSIMTVLGLLRAEAAGIESPVSVPATIDALISDTSWVDNVGDLGLLLWLGAASSTDDLKRVQSAVNVDQFVEKYPVCRGRHTMELAWFLTGLAYVCEADSAQFERLSPLAEKIYRLLLENQGDGGVFRHMARWSSLAGVVRGRIGSFADQVYPIYAMTQFARVFQDEEAYKHALRCAKVICREQGSLGQWWWHYDSTASRVIEHYPVYSVHQHGMAPMALLALQEAGKADFSGPIRRGLAWVDGENELRVDMKDKPSEIIWRSLYQPGLASYRIRFKSLVRGTQPTADLRVLRECRPYELGWLLYAFAPLL